LKGLALSIKFKYLYVIQFVTVYQESHIDCCVTNMSYKK
jgi:hypothetical protein